MLTAIGPRPVEGHPVISHGVCRAAVEARKHLINDFLRVGSGVPGQADAEIEPGHTGFVRGHCFGPPHLPPGLVNNGQFFAPLCDQRERCAHFRQVEPVIPEHQLVGCLAPALHNLPKRRPRLTVGVHERVRPAVQNRSEAPVDARIGFFAKGRAGVLLIGDRAEKHFRELRMHPFDDLIDEIDVSVRD